jgi:hypothetical protein
MALTITHAKVTTGAVDDSVEVDLQDWNDNHAIAGSIAASEVTSPAALTKTDDTNVTLTLGGSPTEALLAATSVTVGWTGTLAASRGGTGLSSLGTGVATALGINTGANAGSFVTYNGPLGTPNAAVLTNATGLPISTGVSGLGTGVATALGTNIGTAGAVVTFNGSIGAATGTSLALNGATIGSHALAVTGTSAFSDVMLIGGGSQHINAKLDVTGATVTTGNDSFPFFVSASAPQGQAGFLLYNSASNHVDNKVLFGLQADTTAGRNTAFAFSVKFSDVTDATRTTTMSMLAANNGSTTTAASLVGINWSYPGVVTVGSTTATPAGGSTAVRLVFGTTSGFGIYVGSGAPTVSAAQGSLYLRSDGSSTSTRLYVNTNGSTTWTNVTTAA